MDPSSKVTVEYFDPSGVFQVISSELLSRLPLRNLHWKSPTRPLRSISSLHVDLVPSSDREQHQATPAALSRVKSLDSDAGSDTSSSRPQSRDPSAVEPKTVPDAGRGTFKGPIKERRHQIPGLRQTPYLKVYLLRCDDNETYKASSRKILREWIKLHTPPSQSSSSLSTQENHDAFEWLIVHVVIPDTTAATQARVSRSSGGGTGSGTEKASSTSKWPGRGSSTLFEKLRTDFNSTSKYATDRVAQVRVQKDRESTLPATAAPLSEKAQEHDNSWQDLISKFKSLILTSFDLRVSQYEHDIREKDSQRVLPGWNFCTFFVLKEGLARGFESVGLVEDALVGYDELAVGLEHVIREQVSQGSQNGHGGTFLPYTEDLRRKFELARQAAKDRLAAKAPDGDGKGAQLQYMQELELRPGQENWPLDANSKRYRDLILSSNISIFDFRCYLFSRQMSLLLRLSNAWSSQSELMAKLHTHPATAQSQYTFHDVANHTAVRSASDRPEDLTSLSEICRRALDFTTSVARVMRNDLWSGISQSRQGQSINDYEQSGDDTDGLKVPITGEIIENIVSSWKFSVVQQILEHTASQYLPTSQQSVAGSRAAAEKSIAYGGLKQEPKASIGEPKTMMHPARTSSLPTMAPNLPDITTRSSLGRISGDEQRRNSEYNSGTRGLAPPNPIKPGLQNLAANRAELYLIARAVLEDLAKARGWFVGWGEEIGPLFDGALEEVDLITPSNPASTRADRPESTPLSPVTLEGIGNGSLRSAVTSKESFFNLYEILSESANKLYTAAARTNSVEGIMADLAALKFFSGDYATATAYFHRIAPFYAETSWQLVQTSMLKMYCQCLKQLDQKENYVRAILKLLSKAASSEQERLLPRPTKNIANNSTLFKNESAETLGLVHELITYTKDLQHNISAPLQDYFTGIQIGHHPRHYPDRDGFQLQLHLRYLLDDPMTLQCIKVSLLGLFGGQSRDIWLQSDGIVVLERGINRIWLDSNASVSGSYFVDKILFEAHNLTFVHETLSRSDPSITSTRDLPNVKETTAKSSRVFCYPRSNALEAKLSISRQIHLEHVRSVEIELSSGWNDVLNGELRVRSGSAGLRLRTGEAQALQGSVTITDRSRAGVIRFNDILAGSVAKLKIPYSLENELSELSVKLDVAYTTRKGDFLYSSNPTISIVLPLGVNVEDIFKEKAQFSRFSISAATPIPIRVLHSRLDDSEVYETKGGSGTSSPMLVFPKQSASLVYKIIRKSTSSSRPEGYDKRRAALALTIDYRCLDEDVINAACAVFSGALYTAPAVGQYSRLLMPTLQLAMIKRLNSLELEKIGLLGEIQIGPFEAMPWHEALEGVPLNDRPTVQQWLVDWHNNNPIIPIPIDSSSPHNLFKPPRQIVIPVELPQVQVVHTVDLRLLGPPPGNLVAIGQMLGAELRIRHTRSWDMASRPTRTSLEFSYEIHANPEIWLIGGRRRGHFTAKENELRTFPIMLLPLRAGHLLLPTVEVKPSVPRPQSLTSPVTTSSATQDTHRTAQMRMGSTSPKQGPNALPAASVSNAQAVSAMEGGGGSTPPMTCETDYKNQSETVLVIADIKSTTVSLDPGGLGGAWVLESERWGGGVEVVCGREGT